MTKAKRKLVETASTNGAETELETEEPAMLVAPEEKTPAGVGVLEKAMYLLNIVSQAPAPMTFTQLLRACGLPKGTLHRILTTLQREGLLRHDAYSKTFRLGLRFLELAHEVWSDFDLRIAAQDELVVLRVWVEAPPQVRLARGLARDGEAERPHWERWMRDEAEHFARERTAERADVRLDGFGRMGA